MTEASLLHESEFAADFAVKTKEVKICCKNTFLHFAETLQCERPRSPIPRPRRRCYSDVTDSQAFLASPSLAPSQTAAGSPNLLTVDESASDMAVPPCDFYLPPRVCDCAFERMIDDHDALGFSHDVVGVQMAKAIFEKQDDSDTADTNEISISTDACYDGSFTTASDQVTSQSSTETATPSSIQEKDKDDDVKDVKKLPKGCTTVMLRNIPNKYTREMLIHVLNKRFLGKYDFMYLPIDFNNKCNVGYGFVNFRTPETCHMFILHFHGVSVRKSLPGFNSKKVCEVTPARVQGLLDNVRRLQNSPVMSQLKDHPDWLPVLFDVDGNSKPFPCPAPAKSRSSNSDGGKTAKGKKDRRWEWPRSNTTFTKKK